MKNQNEIEVNSPHAFRAAALFSLKDHPWTGRLFTKLAQGDHDRIFNFISNNEALDFGAFEAAVNRMFIDGGVDRPKRWKETMEILSAINSQASHDSQAHDLEEKRHERS